MASQMNPVIAAFLQARRQAEDAVQGLKQHELVQKRLEIEKEANDAEVEWRKGQLEAAKNKATLEAQQFNIEQQTKQQETQLKALDTIKNLLDKNLLSQGGLGEVIKTQGLSPELAQGFKDFQTRSSEEAAAKAAEIQALIKPKTEEAGAIAGAQAEARLPTDLTKIQAQGDIQAQLRAASDRAAYKRALDVANIRVAAANNPVLKRQVYDSMPASPEELEHFKNPQTGEIPAYGTTRAQLYGLNPNKPLTAGQSQKIVDLQTTESILLDLQQALATPEGKEYFKGPAAAGVRNIIKKRTVGLSGAESGIESKFGRAIAQIGHPLFGASFTKGEKDILTSFVPDSSGNQKAEAAAAKIKEGLEYIAAQKGITYGALSSSSLPKQPKAGDKFKVGNDEWEYVNKDGKLVGRKVGGK